MTVKKYGFNGYCLRLIIILCVVNLVSILTFILGRKFNKFALYSPSIFIISFTIGYVQMIAGYDKDEYN